MLHPQYSRGMLLRNVLRLFRILALVLGVHYNEKFSGRGCFFSWFLRVSGRHKLSRKGEVLEA